MKLVGLTGERVRLVPSESSLHLEKAIEWFNDPHVTAFLDHRKGMTRREAEGFFERMVTNRETDLHWAILTEEFGHIGFIALHQIDWPNRSANGGLVIGETHAWGKGFASESVNVRTRFAFAQLGLHRIEGHTLSPVMRRVYEKCGYRHEGVARHKRWRDGRWLDADLFSILETDGHTERSPGIVDLPR